MRRVGLNRCLTENVVLRAYLALSLILVVASASASAEAEEAGEKIQGEPVPEAQTDGFATMWWKKSLDGLFKGVSLSSTQEAGIDEILKRAEAQRELAGRLVENAKKAQAAGEIEERDGLRRELRALRPKLSPDLRIDAMRTLLDENQKVIFDKNRRLRSDRLFSLGRSSPRGGSARQAKQPGTKQRSGSAR